MSSVKAAHFMIILVLKALQIGLQICWPHGSKLLLFPHDRKNGVWCGMMRSGAVQPPFFWNNFCCPHTTATCLKTVSFVEFRLRPGYFLDKHKKLNIFGGGNFCHRAPYLVVTPNRLNAVSISGLVNYYNLPQIYGNTHIWHFFGENCSATISTCPRLATPLSQCAWRAASRWMDGRRGVVTMF